LAKELRKLPDLKNATAVAKITYLALNATNPEVKEAFELMIKGGTPSPTDFSYGVPRFNTELWGLYQLAEYYLFSKIPLGEIYRMLRDGIPTSDLKQWLLYS